MVNFVIEKGRIARREYVEINNISERTAARDLKDLLELLKKGILSAKGGGKYLYYE